MPVLIKSDNKYYTYDQGLTETTYDFDNGFSIEILETIEIPFEEFEIYVQSSDNDSEDEVIFEYNSIDHNYALIEKDDEYYYYDNGWLTTTKSPWNFISKGIEVGDHPEEFMKSLEPDVWDELTNLIGADFNVEYYSSEPSSENIIYYDSYNPKSFKVDITKNMYSSIDELSIDVEHKTIFEKENQMYSYDEGFYSIENNTDISNFDNGISDLSLITKEDLNDFYDTDISIYSLVDGEIPVLSVNTFSEARIEYQFSVDNKNWYGYSGSW
ncbi:MAG: hypothetical protein ACOCP8_10260, partial [archaeon]